MKALKVFLGIIIAVVIIVIFVVVLGFVIPVKLVEYDTNVDFQEKLLSLASSSTGSRIIVSEKMLNELAGSILVEQLGDFDFGGAPVSFGGMNLHLDNGILSAYILLNSEPESSVPSWIKRIMLSGQFEITTSSNDIVITLKKIKLGIIPLPVKIVAKNITYPEVPTGLDIQNLSYTMSYDNLSKMISKDIKVSNLEIGNDELSFITGLNTEKITEIIDSLEAIIMNSEDIVSTIKENVPDKYSGMVEDGEQILGILRESIENQDVKVLSNAYVSWFEGDVTVQSPGIGEAASIDIGMNIGSGSVVKTGSNSNVEIVFPDGSLLIIQSETDIILEEVFFDVKDRTVKTSISLGVGRVRSIVKKMVTNDSFYEIKTPSSVAGVRGTDFGVSCYANNMNTDVIVLSGTISLENNEGSELIMEPGTVAFVDKKGQLSEIKTLNSKPKNEFIQQMPVNTFVPEGYGNKFSTLFPIILRIVRKWDTMSYEEQQEFISIVDSSIEIESLFNDMDLEGLQAIIPN